MHFLCISYVANKENLVGDHFLYSHDLNIYSAVILYGVNQMLVALKGSRVKLKVISKAAGNNKY